MLCRELRQAEDPEIETKWPRFAAGLLRQTINARHGVEEHAALIKILH
jgi:hypothetical protein